MLLTIRDLTKRFPGTVALDGVKLDLAAGEVHALLGENGAGKSTLIKCLTGVYRRDQGDIQLEGRSINPASVAEAQALGIGTVYQEVNLLPNLTVAENLAYGREVRRFGLVSRRGTAAAARQMLDGYGLDGIDLTRELGRYPVAVQQIIAIARAVALSGKVLILDEPTASLDARECAMLFDVVRRLRDRGLAIVFVSHFLDQVYALCDRMTVLRNGRHITTAACAEMDRMGLVQAMLGRDLEEQVARHHAARRDDGVQLTFTGLGRRGSIAPFDLTIGKGEVVGLAGLLGAGRTETADVMFGRTPADSGTAADASGPVDIASPRRAIAAGFGYAPEDRKTDGIVADLSVRDNIALALQARRGWARPLRRAETTALADKFISALDIRTSSADKPIGQLSGGNQQKAVLARWLAMNPRFLILDEPTRGIDVGAHAEIIKLVRDLTEAGMSILMISSELEELILASDRVIVLRDRVHVAELVGDRIESGAIMQAIAATDAPSAGATA